MKRAGVAFALFVLVAGVAVSWWLWSRSRSPVKAPEPEVPAEVEASNHVQAEAVEQLLLRVNRGHAAESEGEAVFFAVTLFNPAAVDDSWRSQVTFESAAGEPVPWEIELLDRGAAPTRPAESSTSARPAPRQASFGVAPEEALRLPPGVHEIRAVLPRAGNPLTSNSVTLTVKVPAAPATAERTRLEAATRFYLLAQRWEEAHRVASQLAGRPDADTLGYSILGDALSGLERYEEALAAYQGALAEAPSDQLEAPDYLLARIAELQERAAPESAEAPR
jgi:tetratricopeptide (TPR) repeat protein